MKHKVKQIIVDKPLLTNDQLESRKGTYFPESHYKTIIDYDADVYSINDKGEKTLILKFRKGVIPNDICVKAYNALEQHAQKKNYNRGAAAGKLSLKKLPKFVGKITKRDSFRVFYKTASGKSTKDNISNMAQSNIAGYYDRPDRNLYNSANRKARKTMKSNSVLHIKTDNKGVPLCRTTQFTAQEVEKWNNTVPLIESADKMFKRLVPDRHAVQLKLANLTPDFQIGKTAYSTITINYDWRTSLHKDKGDLDEGFGNLLVLEKSKCVDGHPSYQGGFLGFPQWGVAVDVRQGDYLAMDVHQYHCNTEIKGSGRLSVVCYLRKKMINCSKNNAIRN
jgi:hypothetical protein